MFNAVTDTLSIGHLNINSLPKKVLDLNVFLKDSCACHIFGITESRLHQCIGDKTLHIPNYSIVRRDAKNLGHTGVAVYIHDSIKHITKRRVDLESNPVESVWFECGVPKQSILVGFVYRNPASDPSWYDDFITMMDKIENCENGKDIVILGDFNINYLNVTPIWSSTTSLFNLHQIIRTPTRVTKSTETLIDHIYTTNPNIVQHSAVHQTSISDHFSVHCTLVYKMPKTCTSTQSIVTYRSFKHFNYTNFCHDLDLCSFHEIYQTKDPDIAFESFNTLFCAIYNKHAPIKKKRVKTLSAPPWLTSEIKNAISLRDKLKKKKDFSAFKQQRKHVKFLIRRSKKDYFNSIATSNTQNISSIWKAINSLNNKTFHQKSSTTDIFTPDEYNDHFLSVADNLTKHLNQQSNQYVCSDKIIMFCSKRLKTHETFNIPEMTAFEVGKYISSAGQKTTQGHDGLCNKILLLALPYIVQHLTYLYNLCIKSSKFPSVLKKAKVIPLPKIKKPSNPNDYRPISILSALSKPIEKHIQKHLLQFLDQHDLLHPLQSGFRPKHSCQTALTQSTDQMLNAINAKHINGLVFLDFRKAFDLVSHNILLEKLKLYQLNSKTINFFSSYLSNRKQTVFADGRFSYEGTIRTGIPQGSVLGPLLFNIFINDLPLSVSSPNVTCGLFADDCSLITEGTDISHINRTLQISLSEILNWCSHNQMVLNPEKTKCMVVTTRQKHQIQKLSLDLVLQNQPIEQVSEHRHLGVILDDRLSWQKHINTLSKSAARNVYLLSRLTHVANYEACFFFFHAHIMSLINYASNIWDNCDKIHISKLCSVHKRALKLLQRISSSSNDQHTFCKPLPLIDHLRYNKCVFMHKLIYNKCPAYLKQTFQSELQFNIDSRHMTMSIPKPRIDLFKSSLRFSGTTAWNSLPKKLKEPCSTKLFKDKLLLYLHSFNTK